MTQNYTLKDLVKVVYKEATTEEMFAIGRDLESDFSLREEYAALNEAAQALPKVTFAPSERCIQDILRYSRRTAALQVEM